MTQQKRANLGRGLAALFGEEGKDVGQLARLDKPAAGTALPLEKLHPNPYQPRRRFPTEEIAELAQSLKQHGILQPILVRRHPEQEGEYQIVAGERRWRAAQSAQLHEVPAVIKELDDGEALEIAVLENVQRQDLTPIEEAEGYKRLLDEFGHTQEQLAGALGKSRSHIANCLRLLTLPDAVKAMVEEGQITAGHARALVTADEPERLAKEVVRYDMSVRQTEAMVGKDRPGGNGKGSGTAGAGFAGGTGRGPSVTGKVQAAKDADTLAIEQQLSELLGFKVTIESARDEPERGRVTVAYESLEQLDEILRVLNAGTAGGAGGMGLSGESADEVQMV